MKKVAFKSPRKTETTDADEWVQNARPNDREAKMEIVSAPPSLAEAMKRFTIDVPEELHRRIKMQCAMRGSKMADVLRNLLEKEFPKS
jgi:predicted DNA binding CopG/RHH family protein